MTERDELSPEERAAFDALAASEIPSSTLENRVVNQLQAEGLIQKPRQMNAYMKYVAGIAASLLLFFAGNYVGKQSTDLSEINPTAGYMMILKEDANFEPGEPMEMFLEYESWMNGLSEKGVKITGQELKSTGWRVTQANADVLSMDDEVLVTGYFVIEAKSEEEALAVVRDNPHIKYGGIIELKPFLHRQ